MRLVFAGTPEVALPSLLALLDSQHEVVAVVTRPDAPAGRGRTLHRLARSAQLAEPSAASRCSSPSARATPSSSRGSRASRPTAARSWPTARSCRARRSTSRASAGSTCTSRCCRPGAARRPCSTPSGTATTSPAPSTFLLEEGLDTGPVLRRRHRDRRGPPTPAATCSGGSPSPAPGCSSRRWTGSSRAPGRRAAAGRRRLARARRSPSTTRESTGRSPRCASTARCAPARRRPVPGRRTAASGSSSAR